MIRKTFIKRLSVFLYVMLCGVMAAMAQNPQDVTGYQTLHVTIPATAYNADAGGTGLGTPRMPAVKYNKTYPLIISSDDMGKTELTNNWAAVNGYPCIIDSIDLGIQPGSTCFLQMPYKKYYTQGKSQNVNDYTPMTFTDNVGKTHRYIITSAIMPKSLQASNYAKINGNDIRLMRRTGWSFAQHDVESIEGGIAGITALLTSESQLWQDSLGMGLKVLFEPNGNHDYLAAAQSSPAMCWSFFQNNTSEYPMNSMAISDWTNNGRTDWSASGIGNLPSTFSNKPTGGYRRFFFQGKEETWKTEIQNANNTTIRCGGTHGLEDVIKTFISTEPNVKNNAWVAGADEVWEYYHIYNKLKISNVSWDDTNNQLSFDVDVPTYNKSMYRELTLNIPGLTGGTAPTITGQTVYTGGYQQTADSSIGYTMNIGLEGAIQNYINELLTIYRDDQTNLFVKRDIQYLINQLWNGTSYQSQLDAAPTYQYVINASLGANGVDGTVGLVTGKTDTNGTRRHALPRYVFSNGKLYETAANNVRPYYVTSVESSTPAHSISYTEKDITSLTVANSGVTPSAVAFIEGEDMTGVTVVGNDYDVTTSSDGRYYAMANGSGGMIGNVVTGYPATVTTSLPRGKYKMVIGYAEAAKGSTTYSYNVNVDGTSVYSFNNSTVTNQTVTEITSDEFTITGGNTVTISTDNPDATINNSKGARGIDYVFIVRTGSLEPVNPGAELTTPVTSDMLVGKTATLNATTHLNGGTITSTAIYAATTEGTPTGNALATSATTEVSYNFTPSEAGSYYFVSQSVTNIGTTTSSLVTITAVAALSDFTLNIVDKSGNVAMTTTVSNTGSTDPLPNSFRSPFAQNYKYYNTLAEAQANSGANITAAADWIQGTVYVGYDVNSTAFGADKKYAIYNASNYYMHAVFRCNESHTYNNLWWMRDQNNDCSQGGGTAVSATTQAFLDDSYTWYLGTDPYNVKMRNVGSKRYVTQESTNNYGQMEHLVTSDAGITSFCVVYYENNNTDYLALYNRTLNNYVYYNGGNWRIDPRRNEGKLKVCQLPALNINVVNASGNVEYTLNGYYKSRAALTTTVPLFLKRTYTSNQRFYYDAACTSQITQNGSTAVTEGSLLQIDGIYNVWMKYDLSNDWDTDNIFRVSNDNAKYWYAVRFGNNNYLNAGTTGNHDIGSAGNNSETSTTADNSHWAITGTPYALRLINRDSNNSGLLAGLSNNLSTSSSTKASMYNPATEGVTTTWEMRTFNTSAAGPVLIPLGSFSGQTPFFFLYASGTSLNNSDNTNCRISQYDHKATTFSGPPTVTLAASTAATYTGSAVTLTATPTLGGGSSLSNLKFYKKVGEGEWTEIQDIAVSTPTSSTAYAKEFTPDVTGTYTFKATATDDNNDTGTSETVTVTVTAPPAHSTVTLTASSASPTVGSTVTLTATATPVSGSTVTYLAIEQKINNVWTVVGDAYTTANGPSHSPLRKVSSLNNETGEVTVTYDLTAGAAGTDYEYRANATISDGVNTPATLLSSDAAASGGDGQSLSLRSVVPTPEYDTYKFHIIDNAGTDVFSTATITISKTDLQNDLNNGDDPLLTHYPQYCSPFVSNYLYFDTSAEAQANSGNATAWNNSSNWDSTNSVYDVYVGYTVTNNFGSDKKFAIWSNRDNQYMHVSVRPRGSNFSGQINLERQKYNIWNEALGENNFFVGANNTNYALLDNLFMWQLGNDPYNITFKNVGIGYYANPISNSNSASLGATSTSSYCILYWTSHAGSTDTTTSYLSRVFSPGSAAGTPQYVVGTTSNNNDWRVEASEYDNYTNGSKIYFKELSDNAITVNVLDSHGAVEAQFQAYNNPTATMQTVIPYSLIRAYTSNHALYYDAAHTDAVTLGSDQLSTDKLTNNGGNLYMTYTLGSEWRTLTKNSNTPNIFSYDEATDNNANWYAMRYNGGSGRYLKANSSALPQGTATDKDLSNVQGDSPTAKQGQWAFIGTPYNLKITNRYHGFGSLLGIPSNATSSTKPNVYASGTTDVITTWEVITYMANQTNCVFFRPQGGLNGQNPYFYLGNSNNSSAALNNGASGGEKWDFYWIGDTIVHVDPAANLALSASSVNVYVDATTTLTATATPAENHEVTYFAIEQETSTDVWEVVGTAYAGSNVTGATKDAETGVVTVTCSFTPDAIGTYNFRAKAIADDDGENPIYSTNTVRDGGIGSVVAVTASVYTLDPQADSYTIILIDKQGNELHRETFTDKTRITGLNSVSERNGDPLGNDWRSPLVTKYKYYEYTAAGKTSAQAASGDNLIDWNTAGTELIAYVGYEVGNTIDLNTGLTNIYERVRRSNDDSTQVRNAAHFGTMYMLKFHNGVNDYLENGKDSVETTTKKPVYPYANGDGQMYIYDAARWIEQSNGGNSTRTRWAWYLLSPTNDPYHVYVTAWQQSHSQSSNNTNYYNFLRTYYNTTI
ncbi:MAG: hypothetical protein J6Z41_04180, partial [Prevotella sp.]|nr:hypothetical protein [Prevotella sp.]